MYLHQQLLFPKEFHAVNGEPFDLALGAAQEARMTASRRRKVVLDTPPCRVVELTLNKTAEFLARQCLNRNSFYAQAQAYCQHPWSKRLFPKEDCSSMFTTGGSQRNVLYPTRVTLRQSTFYPYSCVCVVVARVLCTLWPPPALPRAALSQHAASIWTA